MKRNSSAVHCLIGMLFIANAVILAGCGGGGGGSSDSGTIILPKSGDIVWSVSSNPTISFNEVRGIAKNGDSLYVVGYDVLSNNLEEWRIEKRSVATGAFITAIVSGASTTSGDAKANAVTLASDSTSTNIYVVGYETNSYGNFEWRIEKRDPLTDLLVAGFGTNGVVTSSTSTSLDAVAYAITTGPTSATDPTLSMYVAGYDVTASNDAQWRIEKRSLVTGLTNTFFGTDGVITNTHVGVLGGDDIAYGIAANASGIYVVGFDSINSSTDLSWRIEKRDLADGSLVTAFATTGVYRSEPTNFDDVPYAVAIDANYLYVAGFKCFSNILCNAELRIEKIDLVTGKTVTAFGSGTGYIGTSLIPDDVGAFALAIDANYMYVAGYDTLTQSHHEQWRIEKRSLVTGAAISSFGTGGVVHSPANPQTYNEALAIVVDDKYIYTAGFDTVTSANEDWRIEKRLK